MKDRKPLKPELFNTDNKSLTRNEKSSAPATTRVRKISVPVKDEFLESMFSQINEVDHILDEFLKHIDVERAEKASRKESKVEETEETTLYDEVPIATPIWSPVEDVKMTEFTQLHKWLEPLGMEIYLNDMYINGFDDINFIKNILIRENLQDCGVYDQNDATKIMNSMQNLPNPPPISVQTYRDFNSTYLLNLCKLNIYLNAFNSQGYNNFEDIVEISNLNLLVVLGIQSFGHRRRLIYYIEQARLLFSKYLDHSPESEKISVESSLEEDKKLSETLNMESLLEIQEQILPPPLPAPPPPPVPPRHVTSKDQEEMIDSLRTILDDIEDFVDDSVKERPVKSDRRMVTSVCLSTYVPSSEGIEKKKHRKITEKLGDAFKKIMPQKLAVPETPKTVDQKAKDRSSIVPSPNLTRIRSTNLSLTLKNDRGTRKTLYDTIGKKREQAKGVWIHAPTELYYGSINVESQFLGMCPIRDITRKGRRLVHEAVEKLKNQSMSNTKMPNVIIQITAFDLSILNGDNNFKIYSHDINSVLFCSQDVVDQRVFCYVYMEDKGKKFLCNVFRCASVKNSTEAILALGLAFSLCSTAHAASVYD